MAASTSVQAVRPCSKDRWSGWTFGTYLCAGTDPLRIKVTHEPDTCHLGLRLPAGAFFTRCRLLYPHTAPGSCATVSPGWGTGARKETQ